LDNFIYFPADSNSGVQMGFSFMIESYTPLVGEDDPRKVTKDFLTQIGYLTSKSKNDSAFRLFYECFYLRPDKVWEIGELMTYLDTSKITLYRHLNKLKSLDLLEEINVDDQASGKEGDEDTGDGSNPRARAGRSKKGYKMKYGNFATAWNFVEANVEIAMSNYRKTVDHLQALHKQALQEFE